jgi:hypothetical protein
MQRARSIVMPALSIAFGIWFGIAPAWAGPPQIPLLDPGWRPIVLPMFGLQVQFSIPRAFEFVGDEGSRYRTIEHKAVPKGETLERWTQMIRLTAYRKFDIGLAPDPTESALAMSQNYQPLCPTSFGQMTIEDRPSVHPDIFVVVMGCGSITSGGRQYGETTMLVVLRSGRESYQIAWSVRTKPSARPALDSSDWPRRLFRLRPITVCPPDRDASQADCPIRY